jgi:hypothetical protein
VGASSHGYSPPPWYRVVGAVAVGRPSSVPLKRRRPVVVVTVWRPSAVPLDTMEVGLKSEERMGRMKRAGGQAVRALPMASVGSGKRKRWVCGCGRRRIKS